jgi:hypothetical protein
VANNLYHVLANVPTGTGRPVDVFFFDVVSGLMTNKITGAEGMRKIVDEMNK